MEAVSCILLSIIIFTVPISGGDWGYSKSDQLSWPEKYKQCGGKMQSPIAISSFKAIKLPLPALEMKGYNDPLPGTISLTNNGHTAELRIRNNSTQVNSPEISHAVMHPDDTFQMEQLHFHWGTRNNKGSEHTVNGIRYSMEMHIVHRNKAYSNMSSALQNPDGVVVLGIFFQLQEDDNDELSMIVDNLQYIKSPNTEILLNITAPLISMLPCHKHIYYAYKGSLTTPPCTEDITWIIFPHPVPISARQINQFRTLNIGNQGANVRLLQAIGRRLIYMRNVTNPIHSPFTPPSTPITKWLKK